MARLGGCPKCGGDLVQDTIGDIKCMQCGTIVQYSKTEFGVHKRGALSNGKTVAKIIYE